MKNILVTGSSDGIGRATAIELSKRGCSVIVHGRDESRVADCARQISEVARINRVSSIVADFRSLSEVRAMAQKIRRDHDTLDVLINNAGIATNRRELTPDGYESTFAVNHLAPFLLTNLLLDHLRRSATARIVNVSSDVHASGSIDFDDLHMRSRFDGWAAYCNSKLANALFTRELAKRTRGSGITANFLHPGVIDTKLLRVNYSGGSPVELGARTSVYLALDGSIENVSGEYFVDQRQARLSPIVLDDRLASDLWRVSAELTGL